MTFILHNSIVTAEHTECSDRNAIVTAASSIVAADNTECTGEIGDRRANHSMHKGQQRICMGAIVFFRFT
jgi:hypothetical protein